MSVSAPDPDGAASKINTSFSIDDRLSRTVDAVVARNPRYNSRADLFREAVLVHLGFEDDPCRNR